MIPNLILGRIKHDQGETLPTAKGSAFDLLLSNRKKNLELKAARNGVRLSLNAPVLSNPENQSKDFQRNPSTSRVLEIDEEKLESISNFPNINSPIYNINNSSSRNPAQSNYDKALLNIPKLKIEDLDMMINSYKMNKISKPQYTKDMYYDNLYDTYRKLNEKTKIKGNACKLPIKKEKSRAVVVNTQDYDHIRNPKVCFNKPCEEVKYIQVERYSGTKGIESEARKVSHDQEQTKNSNDLVEKEVKFATSVKSDLGNSKSDVLFSPQSKKEEPKRDDKHDTLVEVSGKHSTKLPVYHKSRLNLLSDSPIIIKKDDSNNKVSNDNTKQAMSELIKDKGNRSRSLKSKPQTTNLLNELNRIVADSDEQKQNSIFLSEKVSRQISSMSVNRILNELQTPKIQTIQLPSKEMPLSSFVHKKKRSMNLFCCF